MSDRLYLSCWVRGFNEANMLRHYSKLLDHFPFSKLATHTRALRIYAVEFAEPPVVEKPFEAEAETPDILAAARDFAAADCVCELDAAWDLWNFDKDWKLAPAAVTISCFGPQFENEHEDHLRIDFGLDAKFLPAPELEGSLRMHQSNLRSLLHLVSQIEKALPLSRRSLWSESGANFAEMLAKAVDEFSIH
jgi:hypothetical protein